MNKNAGNKFNYSITHWFQPIHKLETKNIIAYEALLRDASSNQVSPIDIFTEADKNGHRNILDLASIQDAVDTFNENSNMLFVNIFPSTIILKNFLSWWDIHVPSSNSIVLELLESEPINNWEKFKTVVQELKNRGIKIAVDDMGTGYSFFQQWVELDPDFIKLDRYYSEDLSVNSKKQKIVSSLIELFSDTTKIIIEGIETKEDLDAAEQLGVDYAQGFFLGRPLPKEYIIGTD